MNNREHAKIDRLIQESRMVLPVVTGEYGTRDGHRATVSSLDGPLALGTVHYSVQAGGPRNTLWYVLSGDTIQQGLHGQDLVKRLGPVRE